MESCDYRRVLGTGHCVGQGDLMHVVRACQLQACASCVVRSRWIVRCSLSCWILSGRWQAHCGVGERLFDLVPMVFRLHEAERNPALGMQTLAQLANTSMGTLAFRYEYGELTDRDNATSLHLSALYMRAWCPPQVLLVGLEECGRRRAGFAECTEGQDGGEDMQPASGRVATPECPAS